MAFLSNVGFRAKDSSLERQIMYTSMQSTVLFPMDVLLRTSRKVIMSLHFQALDGKYTAAASCRVTETKQVYFTAYGLCPCC